MTKEGDSAGGVNRGVSPDTAVPKENDLRNPSLLRGILECGSTTCRKTNQALRGYFPLLSRLPLLTWLLETSEETLSKAALRDFTSMRLIGNLDKALTAFIKVGREMKVIS